MTAPLRGQPLDPAEVAALTRLARGHRYDDIALDTYGGLSNVKNTLRRTYAKLGARGAAHAIALAIAARQLPADVATQQQDAA